MLISGGTGAGKTTLLNILSSFIPADRADRHHRGLGRAPAPPAARGPAGDPPGQHRGPGRGAAAHAAGQRAPYAARPHHHGRGARRRSGGHAPGDEHRPRRLAHHPARQHAARRAEPARDDDLDGQPRPAREGDAAADRQRHQRGGPGEPPLRRHPQGDADLRDRRHGRRHHHHAGHLRLRARGHRTRTSGCWAGSRPPASGRASPTGSRPTASTCRPCCSPTRCARAAGTAGRKW